MVSSDVRFGWLADQKEPRPNFPDDLMKLAACMRPFAATGRETLTDADALVVQLSRSVAVVAQPAVLAVLAPGVVLAADARDDVQVFDVAAAVGVAEALTV